MMGFLTGSLLGGRISDRIGRKAVCLLGLVVIVPSVLLGGFVHSYWTYVALRYLCCTAMVFGWIGCHVFVVIIHYLSLPEHDYNDDNNS